jgi:predicted metal-binding membrane protein
VTIETLLKRDRRIVLVSLAVLTLLAWVYLFRFAGTMSMAPSKPDMPGMPGMAPTLPVWTTSDFALVFVMWAVMMVGMMTPSATPMILSYARVARQAAKDGRPLAATGWFAAGYLLGWTTFSLIAAIVQGTLERLAWLTPMMTAASQRIGGVVLIAAGVYQFASLKYSCLSQCQSPFAFIQARGGFKPGVSSPLRLGFRHGLYCIGCCWALMALLFAVGVMNIFWIAAIAIFVLLEKSVPAGRLIARVSGAGLVMAGIWLLVRGN